MKSISTRFLLVIGVFAIAFSAVLLYRAYASARKHVMETTANQAELALEFDLAIRDYAAAAIRPAMEKRLTVPTTLNKTRVARWPVGKRKSTAHVRSHD